MLKGQQKEYEKTNNVPQKTPKHWATWTH